VSPVEVTKACLVRIDARDKDLRAFVLLTPERALAVCAAFAENGLPFSL
jgi:Asp-tRNA(Asn)/Glu-tRNA(Gln) amidotransferase A subunit family amidase